MGSDHKRLGGAELVYQKVERIIEVAVLGAMILSMNIILLNMCASFPKVYTAL
jgi:hypothetical protein